MNNFRAYRIEPATPITFAGIRFVIAAAILGASFLLRRTLLFPPLWRLLPLRLNLRLRLLLHWLWGRLLHLRRRESA